MHRSNSLRAVGLILFVGLVGLWTGCGGPNYKARASVKGKVSIGKKSLTTGSVVFLGKNNITASASIDVDGNYDMPDAPLGEVAITVTAPKAPPGGIGSMKGGPAIKGLKDAKSVDPTGSGKTIAIMGNMPSTIVTIPEKYSKAETSGLTYTVEKGEHVKDLELDP